MRADHVQLTPTTLEMPKGQPAQRYRSRITPSRSIRSNIRLYSGDPSSSQYSVDMGESSLIGIERALSGRTMKSGLSGSAMLYIFVPFLNWDLMIHFYCRGNWSFWRRSSSSRSSVTPRPGSSGTRTNPLTGSRRSFTTSLLKVSLSLKKWKSAEGNAAII